MPKTLDQIEDGAGRAGPAKVTIVPAGANKRRVWGIAKSATPDATPAPTTKEQKMPETPNPAPAAAAAPQPPVPPTAAPPAAPPAAKAAPTLDEILAACKGDKALCAAVDAALDTILGPHEEPEGMAAMEKMAKADPKIAAVVAKAKEQLAKAEAEAKSAKEALAKAEEEKELGVAIAKARSDYRFVAGKPEEIGAAMRAVAKADPKAASVLDAVLKGASEAMKASGLFKEAGVTGSAPGAGSAEGEVKAKVEELCKSDPKLTPEMAFTRLVKANPTLHARLEAERTAE